MQETVLNSPFIFRAVAAPILFSFRLPVCYARPIYIIYNFKLSAFEIGHLFFAQYKLQYKFIVAVTRRNTYYIYIYIYI